MKASCPTRKWLSGLILTVLFVPSLFTACTDTCQVENTYVYYTPVYSTSDEIKAAVEWQAPRALGKLGKIYFKDDILYINELAKGIHVIDNTNPAQPQPLGFLNIPGNFDLAIKGDVLYADSFIDLVAFNIVNLSNVTEVARIEGLFGNYNSLGFYADSERGIVTDWERVEEVNVYESECEYFGQYWGGIYYREGIAVDPLATFDASAAIAPGNNSTTGIGGSMARFTIGGDHLYALDGGMLDVVNLEVLTDPQEENSMNLSWDAETLFPYGDKLFVGSRSGMYILDLTDPADPVWVSTYEHMRSCDPVVVEGDYAYVTLRDGNTCEGFVNQLEVIDISNLESPALVKVYEMTNPYGLGIDNGTLFICDGPDGLKVFDATDVTAITENQLAHYGEIQALDIIPYQQVAMMIGDDALYQYDYSNLNDIKLLSRLGFTPN